MAVFPHLSPYTLNMWVINTISIASELFERLMRRRMPIDVANYIFRKRAGKCEIGRREKAPGDLQIGSGGSRP